MIRNAHIITIVLLIVPLLVGGEVVQGQANSTVTTNVTLTSTGTQVNSVLVGTSVTSFTMPQLARIFSGAITLPPTHGVCGQYIVQSFIATAGAIVSGSLTSNNSVDFYFMADTVFQAWTHQIIAGGNCTPANALLSRHGTTSFNFNATIRSDGKYDLVLNNLSNKTVNVNLNADISTFVAAHTTIVLYSTTTIFPVYLITLTSVEVQPAQNQSSPDNVILISVALIIVIAVVLAYRAKTKQKNR